LGGTVTDVDMIVEQPLTGETAFVQVKASSRQAELDDYIERFKSNGRFDRFMFVCAAPQDGMSLPGGCVAGPPMTYGPVQRLQRAR
jgi:hypothetical protein